MKIYISKQDSNVFSFLYINKEDFFVHHLSIDNTSVVDNDDLLRVSIISTPFVIEEPIQIYGIEVSKKIITNFSKLLNIAIDCKTHDNDSYKPLEKISPDSVIYLGFSGGFDSLAAKSILPKSTKCVSIEFGAAFKRESDFFIKFDTNIVSWDLRKQRTNSLLKYKENINWRFMLAPISLFKGSQSNIIIATGTILEASPFWFTSENRKPLKTYSDFGFGIGISLINPIVGLTEYATTLIVCKDYSLDVVQDSLKSLAPRDSFKYHRKLCLIATISNDFSEIKPPQKKHVLGSSFADDFLTLYFCWKKGKAWVKSYYADNITDDTIIHDMSFVEKIHERNMNVLDTDFKKNILEKIREYGLDSYTQDDYENLDLVREQLLTKQYS